MKNHHYKGPLSTLIFRIKLLTKIFLIFRKYLLGMPTTLGWHLPSTAGVNYNLKDQVLSPSFTAAKPGVHIP